MKERLVICPVAKECELPCPVGHNKPHKRNIYCDFYCVGRDMGDKVLTCVEFKRVRE